MGNLNEFFRDLGRNAYGLGENVASLGSAAIAEPVAGFAAMYDPANGAQAIREGMTYTPRTQAGQMYQQGAARTLGAIAKPAMPVIETWQRGVDIAGGYSPMAGAMLRTVPAAIGVAMGAKPSLQAGRQVSNSLGAMQARMIANANAPRTLNTGYMGQRGTFAGINALTADRQALAKAQDMIARGVDPAKVWQETGWGRGADGKWRFEINDKYDITDNLDEIGSRFPVDDEITRNLISGRWKGARSTDMLSHDDLYAAYPEFKNMGIAKETGDSLGSINQDGTQAYINNTLLQRSLGGRDISKPDNAHSVLMHEIQHAIQGKEGFARGGSPQTVNQSIFRENQAKYFDDLITQLEEKLPKPNQQWIDDIHDPIEAQIEKIKEQKYNLSNSNVGFDAYRSLAGEVEARTTQSRMDLNAQQRRENYPFDYKTYGYDVPAKSQTVDFGNNKAMSQRPLTEFEQAHLLAQQRAALPVNQRGLDLPANNTAMDRARAMGFDVDNPVYHGTNVDIEAFDPINHNKGKTRGAGSFLTDSPLNAETYINGSGGGNILPVFVNKKGFIETNAKGQNWNDIDFEKLRTGRKKTSELLGQGDVRGEFTSTDELSMLAGDAGLKGIILNNIKDTGPNSHIFRAKEYIKNKYGFEPSSDWKNVTGKQFTEARDFVEKQYKTNKSQVTAVNDPSTIRSRFAAFDPFNRDSSNILAQSAKFAPAATLGALMANEKRKDKRN